MRGAAVCLALFSLISQDVRGQTASGPSKQLSDQEPKMAQASPAPSGQIAVPPIVVTAPPKKIAKKKSGAKAPTKSQAGFGQPAPATDQPQIPAAVKGSLSIPPIKQRYQLPQKSYSITATQIDETINLKDPEDAVKYMPSLFVRKRNDGDNQAVLATRTWGLNSSARTLIYYDDLLISALIGNNNTGASPTLEPDLAGGDRADRFPQRTVRGRLSRQFHRRRAADHLEDAGQAVRGRPRRRSRCMPWNQYGTKDTYVTSQTSAAAGNRDGALSWLVSANYLDSYQQPLTYTTNGSDPGRHDRDFSRARTSRDVHRQRRRHRRAGAFAADVRQSPARLRHHAAGAGDLFVRDLE